MDAIIFCGGRGTRLSEKTKDLPKPLVEIGENPIVWHIMKTFEKFGHKKFILTLGYKGDLLKQWFLNYKYNQSFEIDYLDPKEPKSICDWKVMLKDTGLDSGTACRLKQVKEDIKSDQFIATYGDGLADIDLNALVEHHNKMKKEKGVIVTISAFQLYSKFGVINHAEDLVCNFDEKPQTNDWINMGFFVCEKDIFDYINDDPLSMLVKDVFPKLAKEGKLAVYKHDGFFQPMDTFKDYVELNKIWEDNQAKWKNWEN